MDTSDSDESSENEQSENWFMHYANEYIEDLNSDLEKGYGMIVVFDKHAKDGPIKEDTDNNVQNVNNNIASDDVPQELFYIDKNTSLDAIALQYDSSDPEDNNIETVAKISNVNDYRIKNEVVLSSDESSDSESDSSSSDSSSSDSDDSSKKSSKSNSKSDNSDHEDRIKTKGSRPKKVFKQKGELDDLPPIEDLKISVPEVLCDPLGEVAWTVEQMVVVKPKPGKPTLNLDTVLFIEKGQRALGHIFDVFGQVAEPHYCVRFNSSDHIRESDIKVDMTVYYCPNTEYTSLVFLSELTKMKAADDLGDDEPPQFSDDEEEQAYLTGLKNNSNNNVKETTEIPNKRRRGSKSGWQSNHPWNNNRESQSSRPQNGNPQNSKPFYRAQHPWSRPRFQRNPWHQHNNPWMSQYPYNYLGPTQPMEMQNIRFPQVQWNPHYQLSPINPVAIPPFSLVPPFTLPPPPPPPPPPPNADP